MKRKQRFFKLSAIVGCILLGVGIVMGSAGFVAMGCDLDAFTYPRVEANPQSGESASSESGDAVQINGQEISHVPADTVDSLEIHASMGNVTVERTAGSQEVEIILTENVYQATVEEGLLVVRPLKSAGGQNGWNWYQLLNLHSNRDWDVTIRVPEKLLDSVFVETDMGTVDLSDLEAGSVTVQGDMGDVTLDNVSASESMTVTQSMGRETAREGPSPWRTIWGAPKCSNAGLRAGTFRVATEAATWTKVPLTPSPLSPTWGTST